VEKGNERKVREGDPGEPQDEFLATPGHQLKLHLLQFVGDVL